MILYEKTCSLPMWSFWRMYFAHIFKTAGKHLHNYSLLLSVLCFTIRNYLWIFLLLWSQHKILQIGFLLIGTILLDFQDIKDTFQIQKPPFLPSKLSWLAPEEIYFWHLRIHWLEKVVLNRSNIQCCLMLILFLISIFLLNCWRWSILS